MENSIKDFNKIENDRLNEFIKDALQYPLRFYTLLLLAGENATEARKLLFNIKYAMMRSANIQVRKRLIGLLKGLIDIITGDSIIYSRLRSLAMNDKLNSLKEESKIFLNDFGFNENNMNDLMVRKSALNLLSLMLHEETQGVVGTGLGVVGGDSQTPTLGIDSFDPLLTPIIKRSPVFREVKKIRKRRKKG